MTVLLNDPQSASVISCACGCGVPFTPSGAYTRYIYSHRPCWRIPEPIWDGECLRWSGKHHESGYGLIGKVRVHRFYWELFNGPIPTGLTLDHVYDWGCRHRDCFRISHLEAVTRGENASRSLINRERRAKTHCPHGHPYSPENTIIHVTGGRLCRTCVYVANAARGRARRREGK